jgi:hypothetical protein
MLHMHVRGAACWGSSAIVMKMDGGPKRRATSMEIWRVDGGVKGEDINSPAHNRK